MREESENNDNFNTSKVTVIKNIETKISSTDNKNKYSHYLCLICNDIFSEGDIIKYCKCCDDKYVHYSCYKKYVDEKIYFDKKVCAKCTEPLDHQEVQTINLFNRALLFIIKTFLQYIDFH